jgi:hypothetical protein
VRGSSAELAYPGIELLYIRNPGTTLTRAPVTSFVFEALLLYDNGDGSQCFQSAHSAALCLGLCSTEGVNCRERCPKDLGYYGTQNSNWTGDSTKLLDVNGAWDSRFGGMSYLAAAAPCAYTVACNGTNGVGDCPNVRINRAGDYSLKFRFPKCPSGTNAGTCEGHTADSSRFIIKEGDAGVDKLQVSCILCEFPQSGLVERVLPVNPKVEAVDLYGNVVSKVETVPLPPSLTHSLTHSFPPPSISIHKF